MWRGGRRLPGRCRMSSAAQQQRTRMTARRRMERQNARRRAGRRALLQPEVAQDQLDRGDVVREQRSRV